MTDFQKNKKKKKRPFLINENPLMFNHKDIYFLIVTKNITVQIPANKNEKKISK